jgi:hypothetical protein
MIHILNTIASSRPPAAVSKETVRSLMILARCGTTIWVSKVVAETFQGYFADPMDLPCELPPFIQRRTDTVQEEIRQKYAMERSIRERLMERRSEIFRERIGSALLFDAYC